MREQNRRSIENNEDTSEIATQRQLYLGSSALNEVPIVLTDTEDHSTIFLMPAKHRENVEYMKQYETDKLQEARRRQLKALRRG